MTEPQTKKHTELRLESLTAEAFSPYGAVIEAVEGRGISEWINDGTCSKFPDLCTVDIAAPGRAVLSIYRPNVRRLPLHLTLLERHPLGSQAFVPLNGSTLAIVVTDSADDPRTGDLRAFRTNGRQGIQLHQNVWHHPLIALDEGDLLVIDRLCIDDQERQNNLETVEIESWHRLLRS